jgi:hypothetical protein
MKGTESIDNCLPSTGRTVCHNEVCMSGFKCLKAAKSVLMQTGKDAYLHPQTNKTWSMLLRNCCNTWHQCCLSLVQISSVGTIFMPHSHSTNSSTEPFSQYVTAWPWATVWPGLSSVAHCTTKVFQYCPYFLIPFIFASSREKLSSYKRLTQCNVQNMHALHIHSCIHVWSFTSALSRLPYLTLVV